MFNPINNALTLGRYCLYIEFNLTPILTLLSDYLLAWYTYLSSTYLSALNRLKTLYLVML